VITRKVKYCVRTHRRHHVTITQNIHGSESRLFSRAEMRCSVWRGPRHRAAPTDTHAAQPQQSSGQLNARSRSSRAPYQRCKSSLSLSRRTSNYCSPGTDNLRFTQSQETYTV